MKIFSLETKKHLVGWGLGLGLVIDLVLSKLTLIAKWDYDAYIAYFGFPLNGAISQNHLPLDKIFLFNLFFWILISLIVLSLVRHFRKKNEVIHQ